MKIGRTQFKQIIKEELQQVLMENGFFDEPTDPYAAAEAEMQRRANDAIRNATVRQASGGGFETSAEPPRPVDASYYEGPPVEYYPGYDPTTGLIDFPPMAQWSDYPEGVPVEGFDMRLYPLPAEYEEPTSALVSDAPQLPLPVMETMIQEVFEELLNEN